MIVSKKIGFLMDAVAFYPKPHVQCLFEGGTPHFRLPNEITRKIFHYLDVETLRCAQRVCRYFESTIKKDHILQTKVIQKVVLEGISQHVRKFSEDKEQKIPLELFSAAAEIFVLTYQGESASLTREYPGAFRKAIALALVKQFPEEALKCAEEHETCDTPFFLHPSIYDPRDAVINAIIDSHLSNKQLMDRIDPAQYEKVRADSPLIIMRRLQRDPKAFRKEVEAQIERLDPFGMMKENILAHELLTHAKVFHKIGLPQQADSLIQEVYAMLKLDLCLKPSYSKMFQVWALINVQAAVSAFIECKGDILNPTCRSDLVVFLAHSAIEEDKSLFLQVIDLIETERVDGGKLLQARQMLVPVLIHLMALDVERGAGLLRVLYKNSLDRKVFANLLEKLAQKDPNGALKLCLLIPALKFEVLCILQLVITDPEIQKEILSMIQSSLVSMHGLPQDDTLLMKQVAGYSLLDPIKAEEIARRLQDPTKKHHAYFALFYSYIAASKLPEAFQLLERLDIEENLREKMEKDAIPFIVERGCAHALQRAKTLVSLRENYLTALAKRVCTVLEN